MNKIEEILINSIKETIINKYHITLEENFVMIEIPKDNTKGDYSTNIAMRLSKILHKSPLDIAKEVLDELMNIDFINNIEIAGPGFINFWIKKEALGNIINIILDMQDDYGKAQKKNIKVLEEYVSVNPTGPLHCGHARGAAWGDSTTKILKAAGYDVTREYYINDLGMQIYNLGLSVYARYLELYDLDMEIPEDGYQGVDIIETTKLIKEKYGDIFLKMDKEEAINKLANIAKDIKLDVIKEDLKYFGCEMDSWISEKWIYEEGMVDDVVNKMKELDLLYEQDGAIFFKSSKYGDEKDRVLKKADGHYTYMTPDIANHKYKYDRGFDLLINIWGADHHGYIARMKAAMKALGYNSNLLKIDLCQMVRLMKDNQEVKMSKRTGNAITLRELIDDVGVDAARYFFLSKALDSHLDFDLDLAISKTNDNPVYYVQYAYARICSVLRQASFKPQKQDSFNLLTSQKETDLLKHINTFGDVIEDAAITRAPNKICNYVHKLATYFHSFYSSYKINDNENIDLTKERLALVEATRITLKNALALLGVNAPERMDKEN